MVRTVSSLRQPRALRLAASYRDARVVWHRNNGGGAFSERTTITQQAHGPMSVHAADLDADDDPDVLSASWMDDRIAW